MFWVYDNYCPAVTAAATLSPTSGHLLVYDIWHVQAGTASGLQVKNSNFLNNKADAPFEDFMRAGGQNCQLERATANDFPWGMAA